MKFATKHGLSRTPEYRAWQQMRLRCTDPKHAAWPRYGGRGITVCPEWLESVERFVADMGPRPSPKHELDREKNDLGYSPSNCRWVLRVANCRNRRSNTFIEIRGDRRTLAEWLEITGLSKTGYRLRIKRGLSPADAITLPSRRGGAS
jgi:hypothetical protein